MDSLNDKNFIMEQPCNLHFNNKYLHQSNYSNQSALKREYVQNLTSSCSWLIVKKHAPNQ